MKKSIEIRITNVSKDEAIQNLEDIIKDIKRFLNFERTYSIESGNPWKWTMEIYNEEPVLEKSEHDDVISDLGYENYLPGDY